MGNYIRNHLDSATGNILITVNIKPIPGEYDEFDVECVFGVIETPPTPGEATDNAQWDRKTNASCELKAPNEIGMLGKQYLNALFEYNRNHTAYPSGYTGYAVGTFLLYLNGNNVILPGDATAAAGSFPNIAINGYVPTQSAIFEIDKAAATYDSGTDTYLLCIPTYYINYYVSRVQAVFDLHKPNSSCWAIGAMFNVATSTAHDKLAHGYQYYYTRIETRPQSHYMFM